VLLIAVLFWAFETFSRKRHLFRFLACVCDWNSVFFRALYRILCQLLKSLLHFSEKFINLCSAMLLIAVLFWAFETFSRKMHLFRFLACVCDWNCVFFSGDIQNLMSTPKVSVTFFWNSHIKCVWKSKTSDVYGRLELFSNLSFKLY